MAEIEIRPGEPGDEAAIADVAVRSWRVGFRGIVPEEIDPERAWRPERISERLAGSDPAARVLVAEIGGRLAGFAVFGPSRDEGAPKDVGEIYALYVDPDDWRRGVGGALVEAAIERLGAAGHTETTVWTVAASPRNLRFYEQLGFERDGATQRRESFGSPLEVRFRRRLGAG